LAILPSTFSITTGTTPQTDIPFVPQRKMATQLSMLIHLALRINSALMAKNSHSFPVFKSVQNILIYPAIYAVAPILSKASMTKALKIAERYYQITSSSRVSAMAP
jgi:hypothetical protein